MKKLKAFEKGMKVEGFQYKVGKTYSLNSKQKRELKKWNGFPDLHEGTDCFTATENNDITSTISQFNPETSEYAIVDISVVYEKGFYVIGDKITVLEKIINPYKLMSYDKTGLWTIKYAATHKNLDPDRITYIYLQIDKNLAFLPNFLTEVKNINVKNVYSTFLKSKIKNELKAQHLISLGHYVSHNPNFPITLDMILSDLLKIKATGRDIENFASNTKYPNTTRIIDILEKKDEDGANLLQYARMNPSANLERIEKLILKKAKYSRVCTELLQDTKIKNPEALIQKAIELDEDGSAITRIVRMYPEKFNRQMFNRLIELDTTGEKIKYIAKYIGNKSEVTTKEIEDALINADKFGTETKWVAIFLKEFNQEKLFKHVINVAQKPHLVYSVLMYTKSAELIKKAQEKLIELDKKGEYIYKLAYKLTKQNKPGKETLQNALLQLDTPQANEWLYNFALKIKGANVTEIEEKIIQNDKSGEWIYKFAKDVKEANIEKLQKAIESIPYDYKSESTMWKDRFKRYVLPKVKAN